MDNHFFRIVPPAISTRETRISLKWNFRTLTSQCQSVTNRHLSVMQDGAKSSVERMRRKESGGLYGEGWYLKASHTILDSVVYL